VLVPVSIPLPPPPDACPGILVLHPARDGGVARIRLPGGYVNGPAWLTLADLSASFGDGCLDLTARGNVQLRGVRSDLAAALARQAAGAGLLPSAAHDRARNIMASPLAGLGGRAPLLELVSALDAVLLGDPGLAALPGRFLFSVDDGTGGAGLDGCDVGLLRDGGGDDDVQVVVAGRLTGARVPAEAGPETAAAASRAAVARGVGTHVTRISALPDGGESVAAAIGGSLGTRAAPRDARLPLGPTPFDPETLVIAAPLARLTGSQLALIAALLRPGEVLRLGVAGRLVIPLAAMSSDPPADTPSAGTEATSGNAASGNASSGNAASGDAASWDAARARAEAARRRAGVARSDAADRLADTGLMVSGDDPLADVTACAGAACGRSVADVRAVAGPIRGRARTHWVGCPRQCGCPPDADPVVAVGDGRFLLAGHAEPQLLTLLTGAS
jgi:precorrin-3B synthase